MLVLVLLCRVERKGAAGFVEEPLAALEVERARQDRQRTIVNAEGEAQSAAMIGAAVKQNPGFLQLRRIEAARAIAGIVAGSTNRVFLESDQLLLNVDDFSYDKDALMGKQNATTDKDKSSSGGWV